MTSVVSHESLLYECLKLPVLFLPKASHETLQRIKEHEYFALFARHARVSVVHLRCKRPLLR